jgi:hypothetical protein
MKVAPLSLLLLPLFCNVSSAQITDLSALASLQVVELSVAPNSSSNRDGVTFAGSVGGTSFTMEVANNFRDQADVDRFWFPGSLELNTGRRIHSAGTVTLTRFLSETESGAQGPLVLSDPLPWSGARAMSFYFSQPVAAVSMRVTEYGSSRAAGDYELFGYDSSRSVLGKSESQRTDSWYDDPASYETLFLAVPESGNVLRGITLVRESGLPLVDPASIRVYFAATVNAVPEPAVTALLGGGLLAAVCGWRVTRRTKRAAVSA